MCAQRGHLSPQEEEGARLPHARTPGLEVRGSCPLQARPRHWEASGACDPFTVPTTCSSRCHAKPRPQAGPSSPVGPAPLCSPGLSSRMRGTWGVATPCSAQKQTPLSLVPRLGRGISAARGSCPVWGRDRLCPLLQVQLLRCPGVRPGPKGARGRQPRPSELPGAGGSPPHETRGLNKGSKGGGEATAGLGRGRTGQGHVWSAVPASQGTKQKPEGPVCPHHPATLHPAVS